jgi:hypothetical protein
VGAGGFVVGGALSLEMLGEGIDGSLAGACEVAAGISVRVVGDDARAGGFGLVLLARFFDALFALAASGSSAGRGAVFSPALATTMGAGGGDDSAGLEVDDATRGDALSDMAWSYTNAPPITLTTIVPKAIPK